MIWDIHLLALSPALPLTSTQIFHQLARPPTALAARFLLGYHASAPTAELLPRVLRHGVCSLATFQAVERLWRERKARGAARLGALEVGELPKRLFRNVLEPGARPKRLRDELLPFLDYLFEHYRPCPSSHKGYPLCGSLTEHPTSFALTRYLLDKGADPSMKDGYAVLLAIDKRDLDLVRLLVEGGWEKGGQAGKKRKRADGPDDDDADRPADNSPKRRKKADRVQITSKMRACPSPLPPPSRLAARSPCALVALGRLTLTLNPCASRPRPAVSVSLKRKNQDIVDYLMARGAVPDLKTLAELGRRARR